MHICTHASMHAHMHTCIHACTLACTHASMHTRMHAHTRGILESLRFLYLDPNGWCQSHVTNDYRDIQRLKREVLNTNVMAWGGHVITWFVAIGCSFHIWERQQSKALDWGSLLWNRWTTLFFSATQQVTKQLLTNASCKTFDHSKVPCQLQD